MPGFTSFPVDSGDESEELLVVEPTSPNANNSNSAAAREPQRPTRNNVGRPQRFPVASISSASVASSSDVEEVSRPSRLPARSIPTSALKPNKRATDSKTIDEVLDINPITDKIRVRYSDGNTEIITRSILTKQTNGNEALRAFQSIEDDDDTVEVTKTTRRLKITREFSDDSEPHPDPTDDMAKRAKRKQVKPKNHWDEDSEVSLSEPKRQRTASPRRSSRRTSKGPEKGYGELLQSDDELMADAGIAKATRSRGKATVVDRLKSFPDDDEDDEIRYASKKTRSSGRATRGTLKQKSGIFDGSESEGETAPTRKSGRATKAVNMRERVEDEEIYADDSGTPGVAKAISVREIFQPLPAKNEFKVYHNQTCDRCGGWGNDAYNKGTSPLIYCQGCSTSIHKICMGYRSSREELVTKVGEENFVMQCRRCIDLVRKRDKMAPDLGVCQKCNEPGMSCRPFSVKKTTIQEEKLRAENDGVDPITEVDPERINNALAILFRCTGCKRGFHFNHLPPKDEHSMTSDDPKEEQEFRFGEYGQDWECKDCIEAPGKPAGIVAWRPADIDSYTPGTTLDEIREDKKEYLIRWQNRSYFRCLWMPGSWMYGVAAASMRKAFGKRCYAQNNGLPIMTEKDAIPEEFLRIEIVLDVRYTSRVTTHTEEIDKRRINEVEEALVKFLGLGYEEVVWEAPPPEEDVERYSAWKAAYNEYVVGKYFKKLAPGAKDRVEKYRATDFNNDIVMEEQPAALTGGKLMEYQLEGMNWLLYNYHHQNNVILADEMGLGKTIQVISALAALITERPKVFPFLIVVPNSTCPNWRREIKQWAPSLRVVAYYGVRESREVCMKYELFPDGKKDLAAHIVVTSYEAPLDDAARKFFKNTKWAGMIVDEGQRLKNEKNLLYGALRDFNIPWRVLLTGTPVQNNKLELFTLLQFLDTKYNAAAMDERFNDLTNDNIPELWAIIKPLILRRTKAQVLDFLPPMAQVIVPVTMSTVQKKLYKSILEKSPELLRAIYGKDQAALKPNERGGLNNILMQLRKCLCHPYVYSQAIEDKSNISNIQQNLIDAAAKFQLLDIMLPKLQERGHRVLIFSQFLNQLDLVEDLLDGLGMQFRRLDGNVGTLEKQKRIDAFNQPGSPIFAFLLSTRAGGVGINLATADTVIIMDPDFNPHQDLQALSRAHRIGQKHKVLVLQLMTKDSVEEKMIQIGRKKMALDQAIIESMDDKDEAGVDIQNILKHGAAALFEGDDKNDIKYDSASVDKLLDRTHIEKTTVSKEKTAESQFSFAKVWQNDSATLSEDVGDPDKAEPVANPDFWQDILKKREEEVAREEAARQKTLGRGMRVRQTVNAYNPSALDFGDDMPSRRKQGKNADDSDFDEGAQSSSDVEGASDGDDDDQPFNADKELGLEKRKAVSADEFHRVKVVRNPGFASYRNPAGMPPTMGNTASPINPALAANTRQCLACQEIHPVGYCALKQSGHENCGLCGAAHYGSGRTCPNLQSETQVRLMMDALKMSTESREEIELARTYLRGVLGDLVRRKKAQKAQLAAFVAANGANGAVGSPY